MATESATPPLSASRRRSSIVLLLRLEGLVAAVACAVLYAHTGASWWLFGVLWLAPDLSMLGYLAGPCWGARFYNVVHTYVLPGTLLCSALLLHAHQLVPVALIWGNHIGVDRLLGFGLKSPTGFRTSHLNLQSPCR